MPISAIGVMKRAWLLVVPLFASTVFASQTVPPAPRYPWQMNDQFCAGKVPTPPYCKLEDWPNHDEAKAKLTMLYKTEQFSLLERGLEEISASGKVAESGWPLQTILLNAVSSWYSRSEFDSEELSRIKRWRKARPESHFVDLAESMFWYEKAWSIRGGGYADSVSQESWVLFGKYHRDAERILLAAPMRLRDYPAWYDALLLISINLDTPTNDPEDLVAQVAAKWPQYFPIYERIPYRLQPKWGSSWKALEAYASKWSKVLEAKSPDGAGLYARIYISVRNQAPFEEMRPDWPKLRKSFEVLIESAPGYANYRNYFASFACAARDKDTFTRAMKSIDAESLRAALWIKGHSYEACKTWGFTPS